MGVKWKVVHHFRIQQEQHNKCLDTLQTDLQTTAASQTEEMQAHASTTAGGERNTYLSLHLPNKNETVIMFFVNGAIRISTHGKLLDDLCDEVHSLQTQLVKKTKEPVICLVQNNVYVNYGSPVCWAEKNGLRHTFKMLLVSLCFVRHANIAISSI